MYVEDVIRVAREEIGRFKSEEYYGDFVQWCFVQAFGEDISNDGYLHDEPKVGDKIIFDNGKTALVELVSDDTVYVIGIGEFGVGREFYTLDDPSIIGYNRPKYDEPEAIEGCLTIFDVQQWLNEEFNANILTSGIYDKDTKDALIRAAQQIINVKSDGVFSIKSIMAWSIVRRGSIGYAARIIQAALICNGYSCGSSGANGYFGNDSVEALKRFQSNNKMIKDGLAGKAVVAKLFE